MTLHLLTNALDTALDRTVLPGYSKIGFWLRRPAWEADDPEPGSMVGRVAVVTGGNSGLGKATAASLARLGATVHLVVRDLAKGRAAVTDLRGEVPGAEVHLHRCDVSDLTSVRSFAAALRESVDRVDVLVHNAGAMPTERQQSADGHEVALATHVLGPLLMTELLRPLLAAAQPSRVILVSSGGMYAQKLPAGDPEYLQGSFNGTTAYARTKRMQVALTPLMQERWAADGIAVHAMHPGWADTPGVVTSLPGFHRVMGPLLRDTETGADTIVWLAATEPAPGGGQFWHDRAARPEHWFGTNRSPDEDLQQLWTYVLDETGLGT
ncbi:MAG: SDR family NAD(P)-dependent oxidoreductase [Nocardioidaceae bacterium]